MSQDNIDFDKVLLALEKTLTSPSFYWQSVIVSCCLVISYIIFLFTRRQILTKIIRNKNSSVNRSLSKYLIPILYPSVCITLLLVSNLIYLQFFKEDQLFVATTKLLTLFAFLRVLRISSDNNFFANCAGAILVPATTLEVFGLFEASIDFLDSYALKIGSFRISIYLILKGFIVLLLVFWLTNLVSRKSKSFLENNQNIKSSTKNIISKFIDIVIYCFIAIVLLKTLGVDMTTLAVLGGAIGVGIGFGLQKIASNFISGLILLIEKSIEIGDWVEIDNGNIIGVVKHFGGRYTLIECFDGKEVMVPNEDFIINKVSNLTYSNNRARIEISLGISYKSDLEQAKEIMIACAKENPRCINYPEVECYVTQFGEYDIKLVLYFWVNDVTEGRMKPKSQVLTKIWQEFKAHNIEIPVPQREIHSVKTTN